MAEEPAAMASAARAEESLDGSVPEAPPPPAPRLIDWLCTPGFLLAFGATLLFFDPLQRIARLFGQRPQEVVAGALQTTLVWVFRLAGTRLRVERDPGVRSGAPYLIIANHQSMFDVPIFGALLFRNFPKYISKQELAKGIPSISYNLRRGGNALIDRNDRAGATRAIRELGRQVRERGVSAVIYPEGTRARRGGLRPFKPAGALALFDAAPEVPVVAVAIDESWRLLCHNLFPIPFGVTVRVRIGKPIERDPGEDRRAILEQTRQQIAASLCEWRREDAAK